MTKIKVVDLDEFYNFVVYEFSFEVIWNPNILFKVLIF
jgi:hypothetical protein